MKIVMNRHSLEIVPEGLTDEIYLEHVLGLEKGGDRVPLVRVNQGEMASIAYAEAKKPGAPSEPMGSTPTAKSRKKGSGQEKTKGRRAA